MVLRATWVTLFVVGIVGHLAQADSVVFKKVAPAFLPQNEVTGDLDSYKRALGAQVENCRKLNSPQTWEIEGRKISKKQWCIKTGEALLALAGKAHSLTEVYSRARESLDWYQSVGRDGAGEIGFTGYNSPTLEGSRTQSSEFQYPIYSAPKDLVRVVINGKSAWRKENPDGSYSLYDDRKAIDVEGSLKGKGYEIAYVRDLFSVFILQVQGSGAVLLTEPDGSKKKLMINYAAQNGLPYVALRRVLQQQGVAEQYLTIPGMRKYFSEHPQELLPTLIQNPSYVFFKESPEGPYGAGDLIITAGHSIAIDPKFVPMSAMMLLNTQRPVFKDGEIEAWTPYTSLVLSQDTGGAITGPGRVDIFFGEDDYAELAAGTMNQLGQLYLAVVR